MDNKLGKVICNLRKEKGITQKDLADALNISDKAVSRWECGTGRPTLEMMFQISKYFNISYNDLITARISDDHEDDKIVEEIIKEFSDIGNKNAKRIRRILLFSIILILILIIGIIFTNTYNRFKVYKVYSESDAIETINGTYVETNVRDILYIGNLKLKDVVVNSDYLISVDLYIMNGNEEQVLQNYSDLNSIYFVVSEGFIEIDNLSDYFENIYIRVTITNEKGDIEEYEAKLEFTLDFSNNKIYYNDNFYLEEYSYEVVDYSELDIKKILLDNGFEESNDNVLYKNNSDYKINYLIDSKILSYSYEKNDLRYRYKYKLNSNILEVSIYDDNQTIIQEYIFDINDNNMNCKVGSCNDYKEVLKILNKKVLYLFE